MKVAIFSSKFLPTVGGSELVVENLARNLLKHGVEVAVIAPFSFGSAATDAKLPYRVFRHRPFVTKRYGTRFYQQLLTNVRAKFAFDILHCQQAYPGLVLAAQCKARFPEVKLVFTSHGHDLDASYPRYKSGYIFKQVNKAATVVDGFVALNSRLTSQFQAFNPNANVLQTTNGFEPTDAKPSGCSPYLLFVGRLSKRKGVDTLLRSFAAISEQCNVSLMIVGSGSESPRLQFLTQRLGISHRVVFLGAVTGERKQAIINGALLVVVPTTSWEACSMVTLEAIAAGKAVIGSNVIGINEIVSHGENGLLVEPQNDEQLAAAMLQLIENKELRKQFEQQNVALRQQYSWENIAKGYCEFYENLLQADTSAQTVDKLLGNATP